MYFLESTIINIANYIWPKRVSLIFLLIVGLSVAIPSLAFDLTSVHLKAFSMIFSFWMIALLFFSHIYKGEKENTNKFIFKWWNPIHYATIFLRWYGVIFTTLWFLGLILITVYALVGSVV